MTKEVMKQALEALYGFIPYLPLKDEKQCSKYDKAIKALEEALKQEQDEPVAWCDPKELWQLKNGKGYFIVMPKKNHVYSKPLYEYPQPKQEQDEPVAWVIHSNGEEHGLDFWQDEINALPIGTFLYTTPQTKEWIGLTNEEISKVLYDSGDPDGLPEYARAIEARLKDKNALSERS